MNEVVNLSASIFIEIKEIHLYWFGCREDVEVGKHQG